MPLKDGWAVGAFNVTDLLQFEAVIDAAIEKRAPVIVQTSVKPSQFLGTQMMVTIYRTLAESAPVPVCLHLDHCTTIDYCKKCADAGYTNIMIDASKQSYEENIRQTKEVVDYCHSVGNISVEGELGTVGGVEDQIKVAEDEAQLANPATVHGIRRTHRRGHFRSRNRHRAWRVQDQESEDRFRAHGDHPQDVERQWHQDSARCSRRNGSAR